MPDARRLFIHVGLQKTGTSYLQAALLRSRESLADQGLDLVPPTKRESFELMVVIRDRYADAARRRVRPQHPRAVHRASSRRRTGSRAVYSQESLAAARPAQIERLLDACGDREVHVVVTVRDLARALPSAWQEELKAGQHDALRRPPAPAPPPGAGGRRRRNPWIHLDAAARARAVGRAPARRPAARGHRPAVGQRARRCCSSGSPSVLGVDPAPDPARGAVRPTPASAWCRPRCCAG